MTDPITWAIFTALVGIAAWVSRVALAFGRLEAKAVEARQIACTIKEETEQFSLGLAAVNAAFNLFQVQAAEKYITRDVLKEFEERLSDSRRETTDAIRGDIKELRNRVELLSRSNGNGRRTK